MDQCRQCHKRLHWDDATCPHCGSRSPHYRDEKIPVLRRYPSGEEPDPYRHWWFRLVFPKYQRTGLFMMAVSAILVWCTAAELRDWAGKYLFTEDAIAARIVVPPILVGLLWSLVYGVFMGRISNDSRQAMLWFAICANVLAGVTSAVHTLKSASGVMLALPIWNLINCLLLLVVFFAFIDVPRLHQLAIIERRVNRFAIGASYGLILAVFFCCSQILQLHWSYTFSICITFSTYFSGLVDLLSRSKAGGNGGGPNL